MLLHYVGTRFFHTARFVLCVLSLLTSLFVYGGIRRSHSWRDRWFAWLVYCLVFFNSTLNVMRQFVGIAIIFYLFSDRKALSWKRVVAFTLLATAFHYPSIIGIGMYGMYLLMTTERIPHKGKYVLYTLMLLIPVLMPRAVGGFVQFMIDHSSLMSRYDAFVYGGPRNRGVYLNRPDFMLITGALFLLLVFVIQERRLKGKEGLSQKEAFGIGFLDMLYAMNHNKLNYRFQFFFSIFRIHYLTAFLHTEVPLRWKKTGMLVMIILMVVFWYWTYVFDFTAVETVPYLFWYQ